MDTWIDTALQYLGFSSISVSMVAGVSKLCCAAA